MKIYTAKNAQWWSTSEIWIFFKY